MAYDFPNSPTVGQVYQGYTWDGTKWVMTGSAAPVIIRSYLAGLTLSTAGSSASFSVAPGVAADNGNAVMMTLAAAITKTTAAWAVGSAAGSLDTGSIAASTWYHVYLIRRPDTGVVDVLTSNSATAPTLPTNYTQFRRIGSMKTNASFQWLGFLHIEDSFFWMQPVQDVTSAALTAGTPISLSLASIPLGIKVRPIIVVAPNTTGSTARVRIYSPDLADNNLNNNVSAGVSGTGITNVSAYNEISNSYCNTAQQVRAWTVDSGTNVSIFTNGYIDRRGKDA